MVSRNQLEFLGTLSDAVVIIGAGLAMMAIHPGWQNTGPAYPLVIFIYALSYGLISKRTGILTFTPLVELPRVFRQVAIVILILFVLLVVISFALKITVAFSRVWILSWQVAILVGLCLNRIVLKELTRSAAAGMRARVAVVGTGIQGQRLLEKLSHSNRDAHRVVGLFDDRLERTNKVMAGYQFSGCTDDLIQLVRNQKCDLVLLALPWSAEERISQIIDKLKVLPVQISLAPDLAALRFPVIYCDDVGFSHFSIHKKPMTSVDILLKRFVDVVLAGIGIVVLSPLLLLIALAIKLDSPGPVFFIQKRLGFNSKPILVYKFRTMKFEQQDSDGETLTKRGDSRVTWVGKFLRKTSVDELPQILNVLAGEMSLVGPRPHAVMAKAAGKLYQDAVADYAMRYRVRPGITGWAQVNGWRGETDTTGKLEKRVEHDLYYIENWSLLFDLSIILKTFWVCATDKNAY